MVHGCINKKAMSISKYVKSSKLEIALLIILFPLLILLKSIEISTIVSSNAYLLNITH